MNSPDVLKKVSLFGFQGFSNQGTQERKRLAMHRFPSDSSYLDIVALGTASDVTAVTDITLNGNHLPPAVSDLSQNIFRGAFGV